MTTVEDIAVVQSALQGLYSIVSLLYHRNHSIFNGAVNSWESEDVRDALVEGERALRMLAALPALGGGDDVGALDASRAREANLKEALRGAWSLLEAVRSGDIGREDLEQPWRQTVALFSATHDSGAAAVKEGEV